MTKWLPRFLAALAFAGVVAEAGQSEGWWRFPGAPRLAFARPALELHYAPGEDLEAIDVGLIDDAGETIDIAAYVLTDAAVIEALADAAERGVRVRLFRWPSEYASHGAAAVALARLEATPGVVERFKHGTALMHLKSYCVDGRLLRGGAANFSYSGLHQQNNDLMILRGSTACAEFERAFGEMWGE